MILSKLKLTDSFRENQQLIVIFFYEFSKCKLSILKWKKINSKIRRYEK